jgi:hypothetical protein
MSVKVKRKTLMDIVFHTEENREGYFYTIKNRAIRDELTILAIIDDPVSDTQLNRKWASFINLLNSRDVESFNREEIGFKVKRMSVS